MTPAEFRAYDAALAAADILAPETRSAIAAARKHRDLAREAWKLALIEWDEYGNTHRRSEKSIRRLEELVAQKEMTTRVYERALAALQSIESDAQLDRDSRRRAVKSEFQQLVGERTLVTMSPIRKHHVFEDAEEREAARAR